MGTDALLLNEANTKWNHISYDKIRRLKVLDQEIDIKTSDSE